MLSEPMRPIGTLGWDPGMTAMFQGLNRVVSFEWHRVLWPGMTVMVYFTLRSHSHIGAISPTGLAELDADAFSVGR